MAEENHIAEQPNGLALDVHEPEPVNEEDRGVNNGPDGSDCGSQGSDYPPDYDHSDYDEDAVSSDSSGVRAYVPEINDDAPKLLAISHIYAAAGKLTLSSQLQEYIANSDRLQRLLADKGCSIPLLEGLCRHDHRFAIAVHDDTGVLRATIMHLKEENAHARFPDNVPVLSVRPAVGEGTDDLGGVGEGEPGISNVQEGTDDLGDAEEEEPPGERIPFIVNGREVALEDIDWNAARETRYNATILNVVSVAYENRFNLIERKMKMLKNLLHYLKYDAEDKSLFRRRAPDIHDQVEMWTLDAQRFFAQLPKLPPRVGGVAEKFGRQRQLTEALMMQMKGYMQKELYEGVVDEAQQQVDAREAAAEGQVDDVAVAAQAADEALTDVPDSAEGAGTASPTIEEESAAKPSATSGAIETSRTSTVHQQATAESAVPSGSRKRLRDATTDVHQESNEE